MVQIPWLGCHWFYVLLFYFISLTKNKQKSQPKLKPSVTYPRVDDLDIACKAKLLKIKIGQQFSLPFIQVLKMDGGRKFVNLVTLTD